MLEINYEILEEVKQANSIYEVKIEWTFAKYAGIKYLKKENFLRTLTEYFISITSKK